MFRKVYLVLFALIASMTIGVGTASADPEVGYNYWRAGSIYEHYDSQGSIQPINFKQYGACDSAGYTVYLKDIGVNRGTATWDNKVSMLTSNATPNGCNYVTIYCKNGSSYTWATRGGFHANIPVPCNDSATKINWRK